MNRRWVLAYGMQLGQVDIGMQMNYAMVRAAGYGSDGTVVVRGGHYLAYDPAGACGCSRVQSLWW